MNTVNQGVRKLDAMQLVTGQPVYTEDIAPENCLVVKLLRSPHANALVREIDTGRAMRVPGMEAVFTWKDVPQDIKDTFDRLGIPQAERKSLAGVGAQYDSELVYHNVRR